MPTERVNNRHVYMTVFQSREGKAVLLDMLNDLGFFATDPAYIKPELLAFANQLLQKTGVNVVQNFEQRINAMMDCATDRDVIEEDDDDSL